MRFEATISSSILALIALSSGFLPSFVSAEGLCLMLYQMADNDLESFIRDDNYELIQSTLLQNDPTVTTWIYFDALNPNTTGYESDFTPGPLEGIYNADGTPVTEKFFGSRYFTYDYDMRMMIVDTEFPEELNSDTIEVVFDFISYALTDCVAKNKTEFFLAFSSHGGAYDGFGGDANT